MNKQELISLIERQLAEGVISTEDLRGIAGISGQSAQSEQVLQSVQERQLSEGMRSTPQSNNDVTKELSHGMPKIFYIIGAIIAVIGVLSAVIDNWEGIGFAGRVAVTIGISLLTYVFGYVYATDEKGPLAQTCFGISAILAPIGAGVIIDQMSIDPTAMVQIMLSLLLVAMYGAALYRTKRNILILIVVAFASWTYYSCIRFVFGEFIFDSDFVTWATMLLGLSYILIGYGCASGMRAVAEGASNTSVAQGSVARVIPPTVVTQILYGAGTLGVLISAMTFREFFDLITFVLIFGVFFASTLLKSRVMLLLGDLFLVIHIIRITSRYFADSIGWPIALIGIGFLLIGTGYLILYLNKKYLTS
jgi:hypothetical protein